jgi:hypothetical protein
MRKEFRVVGIGVGALMAALISFGLALEYLPFGTPGMYISTKLIHIPPAPKEWGPNLSRFFLTIGIDWVCWAVAIVLMAFSFNWLRIRMGSKNEPDGDSDV